MHKGFVVAGVGSGSGKTTVVCSIIAALVSKGYRVQPFKVGPDYIDPMHHSVLAGRSCRNLDVWMMGEEGVKKNFERGLENTDVAVVEGVGGIYDGLGAGEFASTAHVAKLLNLPVFLVVDAWGISRTAAAIIKGIAEFDKVRIKGVIFNFVGSSRHERLLRDVVNRYLPNIPIVGALVRTKKGFIPERHLGIVQAHEIDWDERKEVLLELSKSIDCDKILELSAGVEGKFHPFSLFFNKKRVAIANDKAFSFIYTESLEALREAGAEVCFFSPINGETIPSDAEVLILPGGYPELWKNEILSNNKFLCDLRNFVDSGLKIYAECGGLIFLSMAKLLPLEVKFGSRPILGYAEGKALSCHPFLKEGDTVKGHVFHYSQVEERKELKKCYELFVPSKGFRISEGYTLNSIFATYLHLNLGFSQNFLKGLLS